MATADWARRRDIAAFALSVVGIVFFAFAGGAFVQHQLEGHQKLKAAVCELQFQMELSSLQLRSQHFYSRYINSKINMRSDETPQARQTREHLWGRVQQLHDDGESLLDEYEKKLPCKAEEVALWREF